VHLGCLPAGTPRIVFVQPTSADWRTANELAGSVLSSVGRGPNDAADRRGCGAKAVTGGVEDGWKSVGTGVPSLDAAKQQLGAWIDSGEKHLENKVDEGYAWPRRRGQRSLCLTPSHPGPVARQQRPAESRNADSPRTTRRPQLLRDPPCHAGSVWAYVEQAATRPPAPRSVIRSASGLAGMAPGTKLGLSRPKAGEIAGQAVLGRSELSSLSPGECGFGKLRGIGREPRGHRRVEALRTYTLVLPLRPKV
jgi:hypothetical protein